jgi:hypothetical protein
LPKNKKLGSVLILALNYLTHPLNFGTLVL